MNDIFELNRFLEAQKTAYFQAISEIRNGKKTTHWMWYIFPQIVGLGLSSVAKKYAIKSREEALAYTDHEVLGQRLVEITTALLEIEDKTVTEILGSPDDLKLKSCMTLFALVQPKNKLYNMVLDKFFGGQTCTRTAELLIYGR